MKSRYIRVSSSTQNNARQLAKQHPDEKLFIDVVSGAIPFNEREQGKKLLDAIERKEIAYLSVSSVDRLGRNSFDIQSTLNDLAVKNVTVKVDNLGIESIVNNKPNPIFKMITDVLSNVSQMERESIRERQEDGIKIAKALGKFKGRAKGSSMSEEAFLNKHKEVVKYLNQGRLSLREIVKQCNSSLSTVQRIKKIVDTKKGL